MIVPFVGAWFFNLSLFYYQLTYLDSTLQTGVCVYVYVIITSSQLVNVFTAEDTNSTSRAVERTITVKIINIGFLPM